MGALVLALCFGLAGPGADAWAQAPTPPQLNLREPPPAHPSIGAHLLTPAEREYLARLPPLRVEVDATYHPYEAITAEGEVHGLHLEMLGTLARAFGIRLQFRAFQSDFAKSLQDLREGQLDLIPSLFVTPDRLAYVEYVLALGPAQFGIVGRSLAGTQAPLHEARYAVERGFGVVRDLRLYFPEARVTEFATTADALHAVARGEADYYYGSVLPTLHVMSTLGVHGLSVLRELSLGPHQYHIGLRKELAPLARILSKGVAALHRAPTPAMRAAAAAIPQAGTAPARSELSAAALQLLVRQPVWRVGAVRGAARLNDIDASGRHRGVAAEFLNIVAPAIGAGVQMVAFGNEAELLQALREGRIDLAPLATPTSALRQAFAWTEAYFEMPWVLLTRGDAPPYWDLKSLDGQTLALAPGNPLREQLAEHHPQIRVLEVASDTEAMDAVLRGAAQAAAVPKLAAHTRLQFESDARLRMVSTLEELPAMRHMALAPEWAPLVPYLNAVLAGITPAERQRMERRWVAQELKPVFTWRRYAPTLGALLAALLSVAAATAWWLRRLRSEVAARRASEEQLQDIGAALPCVTLRQVFDAGHRLISSYYSPGAERFLGIPVDPQRSLLLQLAPHVPSDDRDQLLKLRTQRLGTNDPLRLSMRYQPPGAPLRWLHFESHPRPEPEGRHTAWTGYIADITLERRMIERLEREADARHLLLASASHELRAPTHTLNLALQAIDPQALSTPAAERVGTARQAARTLAQLLDDVLDAARAEHTERALEPQPFALRDLVDEVGHPMRLWADDKGLAFQSDIDDELPAMVMYDPLCLRQVLVNLLSNAVKYTSTGSVRLRLKREPHADGGAELLLRVADSGPGIAPDRIERLFTPYQSARGSPGAKEGSTGLGLSICKALIERMGGSIELNSTVGLGTRVDVRLPLLAGAGAGAAKPAQHTPVPASGARSEGAVLVCDDDDVSRILLCEMLRRRGFETAEAADGAQALERWAAGGVRAVITDLQMAGVDGLELMRAIRERERQSPALGATRIVVCSGGRVPPAGSGAGAPMHDAYLSKPVDVDVLVQTLAAIGLAPA